MIEMVAEHGFVAADIETVCERADVARAHFDRCFADLEDCFLVLHDETMEELCGRVDAVCGGREAWHDRIWAAGVAAMRFLQEDSIRARFLVVSVNGSGSGAQERRDRIVQRIADFLDGGRGGVAGKRPMSRCTAEIAAGAVYNTILTKVESGSIERGEEFLPELIYLATMPYLGARAAEDELLVQPLR
ncbi:MAG TPA: TetR/AcrR family transcriptional regulator [Solirubrobacterales bacterium]|nr:TetR/AcrR family transcriptional regulator [Solirubrobacterales bacterium]